MFEKLKEKFRKKSDNEAHQYIEIAQLPVYSDYIIVDAREPIFKLTRLRNGIMKVRETLYTFLMLDTPRYYEDIKLKEGERLEKVYEILPRAGLIALAGFGGLCLSYRKNIARKTINTLSAMAIMTYFCFPNQFTTLTRREYHHASHLLCNYWDEFVKPPKPSVKH